MNAIIKILVFYALLLNSVQAQNANKEYWIWVAGHQAIKDPDSVFNKISITGFTGVLVSGNPDLIRKITPFTEKYKLKLHVWKWILNAQNTKVFNDHPEWASVNRNGISTYEKKPYVPYYQFMCPGLPEVRNFIQQEIEEYLNIPELDGISLDYCRYVDVILPEKLWDSYNIIQDKIYPEWDYGYHPYMLEKFEKIYGYNILDKSDPTLDKNWLQFRYDQVNEVANEISKLTRKHGKKISASPFPTPDLARKHVRQDWSAWELDVVFPMIYNGFYREVGGHWFRSSLQECISEMSGKKTKVIPGIYIPGHRNTDFSLEEAIRIAIEERSDGVAIFSFSGLSEKEWQNLKNIFAQR